MGLAVARLPLGALLRVPQLRREGRAYRIHGLACPMVRSHTAFLVVGVLGSPSCFPSIGLTVRSSGPINRFAIDVAA